MRMFSNLSANELLGSIMSIDDIVELYKKGFEAQNAILVICAQNEMVRRGGIDVLREAFLECVDEGWLETGTEFAHLVAMGLCTLDVLDPNMESIGNRIYVRSRKKAVVTIDDIEEWIRLPAIVDISEGKNTSTVTRAKRSVHYKIVT